MTQKHRTYLNQLDELRRHINEDFEYYRQQNSLIDRRINELGKRENVEEVAEDMTELLEQRRIVKDRSIKLLPLRDFFHQNYDEVTERIKKFEEKS